MGNLRRRLEYWIRRRRLEAELAEELESHRAMKQEQLEQSGVPAVDARDASRRALGNMTLAREDARSVWIWPWLEGVGQDLRVGVRGLVKRPGFAIIAVLTMALGIGANTAVFSLLDASVLRVLPVKDPHELVFLLDAQPKGRAENRFTYRTFERLRDENRSLANIAAYDNTRVSVTVDGEPELRRGEFVTGNYFAMLGVRPAAGRLLTEDDDKPGKDPVAVISHRYWISRFNGDRALVGKTVTVGKTPITIIGITPREFQGRDLTSGWSDIVLPMSLQSRLGLRDHTTFGLMGRLKPGVSIERAAEDLTVIRRQDLAEMSGVSSPGAQQQTGLGGIQLRSALHGESPLLGPQRPNDTKQARLIASAVAVVLLIACVNIACLMLARAATRQREMAVRLAIGATRARLIRQLLTESLLLALLGGGAALVYVEWAANVLTTVLPVGDLPFDPRQDTRTLVFTFVASVLTGILFGLVPALTGTRVELSPVIQGSSGTRGLASSRHRLAKSLVAAQVALSLVLLVGAGLIVRSLVRLYNVEPGFASERVLTTWIYPTLLGFDHPREMRLYRELLDVLNAIPGIQSASLSRGALGRSFSPAAPDFFDTIGISLVQGRDFAPTDTATSTRVAIISESLARKYFPNESPVGRLVPEDLERMLRGRPEIVGVVKEIKTDYRQNGTTATMYVPYTQVPPTSLGQVILYVRAASDARGIVSTVRAAVASVEPDLALFDIQTVADQLDQSVTGERSTAVLLGCFGALALALATIGLFGTMSHAVASRTKELGIRMSLGADRGMVLRMVLRETLTVVAIGVAIGIPVALAATRLVSNLLFGIASTDALTIVLVVCLMVTVTALAGYFPARRAAHVDPMVALRYE